MEKEKGNKRKINYNRIQFILDIVKTIELIIIAILVWGLR